MRPSLTILEPELITRIVDEAIAHAKTALDTEFLPTQLLLAVNRPPRNVRTYI